MSNPNDEPPGPVSKTPEKRLAESDDNVVRRFSNYKPRKVVAPRTSRDFPEHCGRFSETEMESARDVAMETNRPFTDGADIAPSECFSDVNCTNATNVEAPTAAVPLRMVMPIKLIDTESSEAKCAADGVEAMEGEALNKQLENLADVAKIQKVDSVLTEEVDAMTLTERTGLSSESEGDDDKDDICISSEEQWNEQRLLTKCNCDEGKDSIGKTDDEPANQSVVKAQEHGSSNLMGLQSCDRGGTQFIIYSADRECIEVSTGASHLERGSRDSEVCKSPSKIEEDELLEKCAEDDNLAIVERACNAEPKVLDWDLINLSITEHDHPVAVKVRETLKQFDEYFVEFSRQSNDIKGKAAHTEATNRLKVENRWVRPEKPFGHIPGIEIGHKFQFRCELLIIGLHCQHMSGIDYVVREGKKLATSIVHSGRYKEQGRTGDVLIYSGQGGGYSKASGTYLDQKLENGNLALVNAMKTGYPVRVTYKSKRLRSTISSVRKDNFEYVYDGLYKVKDKSYSEDEDKTHKVFKFELHRLLNQPRPQQIPESSRRLSSSMEVCVLDDVSDGTEQMKIRVVNNVDGDLPFPFAYVANMVYPKQKDPIQLIGCDCINGCSDLHPCHCVMKNKGEIPYNEEGNIIRAKPMVHECGPQCKCPSTCMNRVSQHGPRHELEIFKTKLMGWGLRSRTHIPSGSFICEYVGELLQDNEADERSNDEYLFDIFNDDAGKYGFAIDAAVHGNIGRFINHHCSPNLYAQEVLYDHDDKRMPHIMFFAVKNIPPLKELSYDYNYKIDKVCDKSGNIKMKYCKCGSRVCTGRLY